MRVLWFSITPSLFDPRTNQHNGGGWIASLEQIVRRMRQVELGVAFNYSGDSPKQVVDGVAYYPIPIKPSSWMGRIKQRSKQQKDLQQYLAIIADFKPDIIQIFGSENDFGIICQHTRIPVVIHMQGCLPPYHNALFPVGMNTYDFFFTKGLSWHYRLMGILSDRSFRKRAEREVETIRHCRYFMGRTEWDKGLIELFNPQAAYFHCEEALRDSFLNAGKRWEVSPEGRVRIISVISNPWYKGMDLILKTARLLHRFTDLPFDWNVYGVQDVRFYERKYGIRAEGVNVRIMGTATKDELVDALCGSTCYVHPGYIENSPNSLCEAQLLGVPVLATHVGGIPSLVRDGETGILFPANAPYRLAVLIKRLANDKDLAASLGRNAREQALRRHDPEKIGQTIRAVYTQILSESRA